MSFAGSVLHQADVSGAEDLRGAVAQPDLELAREDDDELPPRGGMPIEESSDPSSRNEILVAASPAVHAGVRSRWIGSMRALPSAPL